MIVGGSDIVIPTRPGTPAADLILRALRRRWPNSYFEDAEDERCFPLRDPSAVLRGSCSRQFFVYRDRVAWESWESVGGTPENLDRMLYFIIQDSQTTPVTPDQVTVVCGTRTREIMQIVSELDELFVLYNSLTEPRDPLAA